MKDNEIEKVFSYFSDQLQAQTEVKQDIAVECLDIIENIVLPVVRKAKENIKDNRVKFDGATVYVTHEIDRRDFLYFECRGRIFHMESAVAEEPYSSFVSDLNSVSKELVAKKIDAFLRHSLSMKPKDQ